MNVFLKFPPVLFFCLSAFFSAFFTQEANAQDDVLFQIGFSDARCSEFGWVKWEDFFDKDVPIRHYVVGKNRPRDWYRSHNSTRDWKAAGRSFYSVIEFEAEKDYAVPLYFVVATCYGHSTEPSQVELTVNGTKLEPKRVIPGPPKFPKFNAATDKGWPEHMTIRIPENLVKAGKNEIKMRLFDGSWAYWDYLALREKDEPIPQDNFEDFPKKVRASGGPMEDVKEVLFAVRKPSKDAHWYANFGYYACDTNEFPFPLGQGGALKILDLDTGEVRTVFEDPNGNVRDPQIHYDGKKCIFSYLKAGTRHYNLYEIDLDGTGLRQITSGEWDDIEPAYLPNGDIVFPSSRAKRWVQCWLTGVATLHRCGPNGENIRMISANPEQENTPWVLPNGQILYMRWEYIDRSQVHYHHLWTANPDGTQQKAFYGSAGFWPVSANYAEPIPGSTTKFVAVVSGHHGVPRFGELVLFDAQRGRVDQKGAVERICGYPKKIESRTDEKYYSTLHGDNIVDESWPRYMAPVPLSEDYFLVSAQPNADAPWGLYLVDRFDNMIALAETADSACFEPVPWRETEAPPVVLDRVDPSADEATVYVADVYFGDGLKGVPRGTAKSFRVFSYNYAYPEIGGMNAIVGVDGPWDVRQILGTVPIAEDGSALFKIPANTPIALQPLDENGVALQQMRSWFVGQPGEFVSCVGCHEDQDATNPIDLTAFQSGKEPDEIAPWRGPTRGFSFEREVQPVLDRYCVACHDGADSGWGVVPFDLRGGKIVDDYRTAFIGGQPNVGNFSTSYINLARYVRRPGLESDARLLEPAEFSARATELFQILRDDHYGLVLDADAWDILISWIDMNAPYHGTWGEYAGMERVEKWNKNRVALQKLYANVVDDSETARGERYDGAVSAGLLETGWSKIPFSPFATAETKRLIADVAAGKRQFPDGSELRAAFEKRFATDAVYAAKIRELWAGRPGSEGCESPNRAEWSRVAEKRPEHDLLISSTRTSSNELAWAADTGAKYVEPERSRYFASKRSADFQALALAKLSERRRSPDALRRIDLAPNVPLYLTKIPAATNAEKSDAKSADAPQTAGTEEVAATDGGKAFWIGTFEITNEQLEVFNPAHDARVESRLGLSHGIRGFYVNSPLLPACRVSWTDAVAFCDWLSKKTGKRFRLPTAAEWERAARAGTTTPTSFGPLDADFSRDANLADQMLIEFIIDQYYHERVPAAATYYDDWIPKSRAFCDGGFLSEIPGSYRPNPFGLFDMFGNVAEWTADVAAPDFGVPVLDSQPSERVVCGGSWRDRPYRAAADFRSSQPSWAKVFDVGFRVVCEDDAE